MVESEQISSPHQEFGGTYHSKEVKHSSQPHNICGGEDLMDNHEQISSLPQEFGGTDHSREVKHSSSPPNVCGSFWKALKAVSLTPAWT